MFFCKKLLKKTCDLKKIVIEQLWYSKNHFSVQANTNETQTAEKPTVHLACESIVVG